MSIDTDMRRAFARPIGRGDRVYADGARIEGTVTEVWDDGTAVIRTRAGLITRPVSSCRLVYARNN